MGGGVTKCYVFRFLCCSFVAAHPLACSRLESARIGVIARVSRVGVSRYQLGFVAARECVDTFRMEPLKLYARVSAQQRPRFASRRWGEAVVALTAWPSGAGF